MDFAQKNDIVTIHYSIAFTNGKIFDSTFNKDPLRFKLGHNIFIQGIEETVCGMFISQTIKKTLPSKKLFGPKKKDLIQQIPLKDVPDHINKNIGQRIEIGTNPPLKATITDISESTITIDANPIQTGKDMIVTIELIDIFREQQ